MNPCRETARQQAGRNILTRTPTRRRLLASKLIDPAPVTRFHTRKFDVGTSLKMTTLASSVRAPYNVATMLSKGLTSPMDTAIKNWASTSGSTTQRQASDGCTNLQKRDEPYSQVSSRTHYTCRLGQRGPRWRWTSTAQYWRTSQVHQRQSQQPVNQHTVVGCSRWKSTTDLDWRFSPML